MTTRQYLRGRWTRTVISAIALFTAEGILERFLLDDQTTDYFLRATVLLAFACLLWNQARTPCLKCRKALGSGALWWVMSHPTARHSPRCPHCSLSIDRDVPDSLAR
jgi:hypothetical protein